MTFSALFLSRIRAFCIPVIVDTHKKKIACIIVQSSGIVLLLDLSQSTSRALIPFQLDYCRRFIQMQLSGNETDISKSLACRQLTHDGVILARKVECKVNRTAERVLIIIAEWKYPRVHGQSLWRLRLHLRPIAPKAAHVMPEQTV